MQIIDGLLEGYYEDLDILIVAPDAEQFIKDFQEEIFVMWQVYAKEPDEKLTRKARDIKYRILDSIKGVTSVKSTFKCQIVKGVCHMTLL